MTQNFAYRPFTAFFLAALVFQVFILQSLHRYVGHDHESGNCSISDIHVHSEEHAHHNCDICLFRFAPTELEDFVLAVQQPEEIATECQFVIEEYLNAHEYRRSHPRGPPTVEA